MSRNIMQETRKQKPKRTAPTSRWATGQHPPMFLPIPGEEPVSLFANTDPSLALSLSNQKISDVFKGPQIISSFSGGYQNPIQRMSFDSFPPSGQTAACNYSGSIFDSLHQRPVVTSFTSLDTPAAANFPGPFIPMSGQTTLTTLSFPPSGQTAAANFSGCFIPMSGQAPLTTLSFPPSGQTAAGNSSGSIFDSLQQRPAVTSFTSPSTLAAANQTPEKAKNPYTFGVMSSPTPVQSSNTPTVQGATVSADNSQPLSSSSNFSGNTAIEATTTPNKQQSGIDGKPLFESTTSNQNSSEDWSANSKPATSSFVQKHKPTKPSPLSQSPLFQSPLSKVTLSGPDSPDTERSSNISVSAGASQLNSNTNGTITIFKSPSEPAEHPTAHYSAEERQEYIAAKRLRALIIAVRNSIRKMRRTADPGPILNFFQAKRTEIMKGRPPKRKAVDDGANDEEGSGHIPAKRQRQNNGQAATTPSELVDARERALTTAVRKGIRRMPITADITPFLTFYHAKRTEIMKGRPPKRNAVDDEANEEEGSGPNPSKRQRQNNGQAATTPPKLVHGEEAQQTPSGRDQEKACGTSSQDEFRPPISLQKPSKGKEPVRFAQTMALPTILESPSPMTSQFLINRSNVPGGPPLPMNLFAAAQAMKKPAPAVLKNSPQTEKSKATTSSFSAGTSTLPRNPPSLDKTSSGSRSKHPSSLAAEAKGPAQSTRFASPAGKASRGRASNYLPRDRYRSSSKQTPSASKSSASSQKSTIPPASRGGKRKAASQLTKDDLEAQETGASTPAGKKQATAQSTNTSLETSAKTKSSISGGKRKAETQLTKGGSEVEGRVSKIPKTSGQSETSLLFQNILDSPRQSDGEGQAAPQKNTFSPSKSEDSASSTTAPRANPFAAAGAAHSPAPGATQIATPTAPARFSTSTSGFFAPVMPSSAAPKAGAYAAEQFRQKAKEEAEKKALRKAIDEDYDSEEDGDKAEWIKKWKEDRVAKQKRMESSALQVPKFGAPLSGTSDSTSGFKSSSSSNFSAVEQFRQKAKEEAEKKAPRKAIDEDYDSEEDGDKAEWTRKWKENRAEQEKKAKEIYPQAKAVFIPGKGFSFSSQESTKDNSTEHSFQTKSVFSQSFASSTGVSRASSFVPTISAETPDLSMEETGPGIASAKKPASTSALPQSLTAEGGTPKAPASLFDRIQRDSDGNAIRQLLTEIKENFRPSSSFNFPSASQPADKTWNPNTPIRFGLAASAPSQNFAAATPPAQKTLFDFSGSIKASPAISGATPAPGSLFGSNAAKPSGITFGAASSIFGQSPTPAPSFPQSRPQNAVFGSSSQPVSSSGGDKPAPGSGMSFLKAAVGFKFGGQTSFPATPSHFPSSAASMANTGATTPGDTAANNSKAVIDASGEPDAEHHEQLNLKESRAGEEDEDVLHECRAKANCWDSEKKDWVAKGLGVLRVLKHRVTGATRTLLRADPTANIVFNESLIGSYKYAATTKSVKFLTIAEDSTGKILFATWLLHVKTAEMAIALAKVLEENKPKSS